MAYIDPGMMPPEGGMPPMNGGLPAPEMQPIGGLTQPVVQPMQVPQQPKISKAHRRLLDWSSPEMLNIADELDKTDDGKSTLGKIAQRVVRGYEKDLDTLSDYYEKSRLAFDLAAQVADKKSYPWPGASNVVFPLVTSAALSFASRAYPAIISDRNVVKGVVYGNDDGTPQIGPDGSPVVQPLPPQVMQQIQQSGEVPPGIVPTPQGPAMIVWASAPREKRQRADRIGQHMSYQLLDQKTGWEGDTDKLLHVLPIAGCMFRKTWYDPMSGKTMSSVLTPKQLVISYKAKSMERAPRATEVLELYPNEIESKKRQGVFLDVELGLPDEASDDEDAPHTFLEQHCWYDLDDDGYREPYIVTVHKQSSKVVRIVARYDAEGVKVSADPKAKKRDEILEIEPVHYYTKYDFIPNIDGGFHGMGFGQLLLPINASINTTLNMMMDAGHLQTVGGGLMAKGVSMHTGSVRFKPGEWKVVNSPGQDVSKSFVPLPVAGPSDVLFQLLGLLIKAGEQIAATNDVLEGKSDLSTMQPTTMLALIEQGLKVFTAIYKRVYLALKDEFEKRYRLNRLYMDDREEYQYGDDWRHVAREDYERGAGVCPYSDPKMVSDMQRMARSQIVLALKDDPRIDGSEAIRRVLDAADIDRPDDLFAKQQQPDPVIVAQVQKTGEEINKLKGETAMIALQEATERSKQTLNYANAIKSLSEADAKQADRDMSWVTTQLDVLRTRMEMVNGVAAGAGGGAAGGAGGASAAAAPTGEEGAEEEPPLEGARRAPDGNWYVPDPERPGKYLQVQGGG